MAATDRRETGGRAAGAGVEQQRLTYRLTWPFLLLVPVRDVRHSQVIHIRYPLYAGAVGQCAHVLNLSGIAHGTAG